jgi:hypothetical protein
MSWDLERTGPSGMGRSFAAFASRVSRSRVSAGKVVHSLLLLARLNHGEDVRNGPGLRWVLPNGQP